MAEHHATGEFGRALRAARESAGVPIHELSEITKVQSRYVEALESETWSRVPGGVIGRGFVRIIARHVGADSEKLVELYTVCRGEESPASRSLPPDTQWKSGRIVPRIDRRLQAGAVVLALAVLFGAWMLWKGRQADKQAAVAAAAKAQEAPAMHQLDVKAVQDTWVRIKAKGVSEDKNAVAAGETISFTVEEAEVELPDAAAVQLTWDGKQLKAVAGPGEMAKIRLPKEAEAFKK